ncbi:hypothetical protein FRC08_013677, partial [Ceratobasidium sp. 394]
MSRSISDIKVLYAFPSVSPSSGLPRSLSSILSLNILPASAKMSRFFQPLATRLGLAKEVANAVLFVHIGGLVHKNIHPGTILLFPSVTHKPYDEDRSLGSAFLVGFTESRIDRGGYSHAGQRFARGGYSEPEPAEIPTKIYEHPNREGLQYTRYSMLHDIYALGVVLLEIGLWQLLVKRQNKLVKMHSTISIRRSVLQSHFALGPPYYEQPTPARDNFVVSNPILAPLWASSDEIPGTRVEIKAALIEYAQATLPSFMGGLYTNIVLSCLTCMDGETDSMLGARFIEIVLDGLDKIQ